MKTRIDAEISYVDYRINELDYYNEFVMSKGWGYNKYCICILIDDYEKNPLCPRDWFVEEISLFLAKKKNSTRNLIISRMRLKYL